MRMNECMNKMDFRSVFMLEQQLESANLYYNCTGINCTKCT